MKITDIRAELGRGIEWRTTSVPPIHPDRFGRDHWSMFAYVETRTVDHLGTIGHAHARTHGRRHPVMLQAKGDFLRTLDGSGYPTILAGGEELPDHDDYDCLDDLIAAGLLEVHMPRLSPGIHVEQYYVDAYGRPITDSDDCLITGEFVTGFTELWLCAHATFSLTERGVAVASQLRQWKAGGGNFASFRMS